MRKIILLTLWLALPATVLRAQSYNITWFKIAGGGGTSSGGQYSMSGTIGQPDASGPLTGGSFSLTGGFWSIISAVQTPGTPNLTISYAGTTVLVSWPATGTYTLQQNNTLSTPAGWANSTYPITTAGGTNSVAITPPNGTWYFRLANP